ncbi:MAG TPA: type II secretion system protein N [Arenimonas sp.]|nr:type II secretion system protein N [Arenimonas sp.]
MPAARPSIGAWPKALQATLVLGLLAQGAHLGWVLLAPPGAGDIASTAAGTAGYRALDPAMARQAFGGPAQAIDASGLSLLGLRLAPEAANSTAILGDGGRQRVYGIGDVVRPGLRLHAVQANHVLLDGPAGLARLALDGTSTAAAPATVPAPARAPAPTGGRVDPKQLMAEAGLRPRLRGGRLDGFTVIARGDGRTLRSAGLQSGDVLLAVNGQALTPERLTELGDMLDAGGQPGASTTLTLERGDTRHTITLPSESP